MFKIFGHFMQVYNWNIESHNYISITLDINNFWKNYTHGYYIIISTVGKNILGNNMQKDVSYTEVSNLIEIVPIRLGLKAFESCHIGNKVY